MKNSKDYDDKEFLEVLEECYENCEFCQLSKRAPLKGSIAI